jgi:hypothetical protein
MIEHAPGFTRRAQGIFLWDLTSKSSERYGTMASPLLGRRYTCAVATTLYSEFAAVLVIASAFLRRWLWNKMPTQRRPLLLSRCPWRVPISLLVLTLPAVWMLLRIPGAAQGFCQPSNAALLPFIRTETTRLFSSNNVPQRKPRRSLEKRPRKRDRPSPSGNGNVNRIVDDTNGDDYFWETAERRSLISWAAREAGEDYWYDLDEYNKVQEREAARRAREPGQISNQKLWTEVLSPYRQNWIGLISVTIIALAFIFKNFPEVIDPPVIPNIPALL